MQLFENANLKHIVFGFFVILCLFFAFKNLDVAIMLFISIVFASSMNPLVDRLSKKMNRGLATSIVLFGTMIVLALLVSIIFVLGAYQIGELAKEYPSYIENLNSVIRKAKLLGLSNIDVSGFLSTIANSASNLFNQSVNLLKGISSGVVYFVTGIIFVFFFLKDKELIRSTILDYFPADIKDHVKEIMSNISHKIGGYVSAQAIMMLGVFILNAIGLLIFQIPYAILLAAITGILDIIPVIGPFIAILICVVAVYEFGIKAVIITLIILCITQLIENNFIRPYTYSKLMNLHPVIIFLSLILGAKYFGFLGVLFGPAIGATVCVLLNELYVRNIK